MRDTTKRLSDKLMWLLTVFLIASFLLFDTYAWGKYSFFLASAGILLISAISNGGKLCIKIDKYQIFLLLFIGFTLLSSVWALKAVDSIIMARTLFRILICFTLLYWHYVQKKDIYTLLSTIRWAGYFIALYTITFYGIDNIIKATSGSNVRLDNEYANVNAIGMICALSCVLQFAEWIFFKFRVWSCIFMVPAIVIIASTQSRKAMLFAVLGILMLIILKNIGNKNFMKTFWKIIFGLALFVICGYFILQLEMFSGINERFVSFFNSITGEGRVDNSTIIRNNLISLGIEWWEKYPILGIGIGNPHILGARYLNFDAYLHNNFVELLCGGGIIGFVIYYSMYVYLFINLWSYRKVDKTYFSVCFCWLILMVIMDYGMVSYYSKTQCFYLMVQFINVECLKKRNREMQNERAKAS